MGFFSWLLCSILVVALVLLLFPFSVRIEFEAGERGARALFFFFKKKVYEYEKKWGGKTSRAQDESRSDKLACRYDRGEVPDAEGVKDDNHVAKAPEPPKEKKSVESEDSVEAVAKHSDETTTEKKSAPAAEKNAQSVILSETSDPVKSESMDSKDAAKPALVSEPISTESTSKSEKEKSDETTSDDSEVPAESKSEDSKKEKPKKEKRKLSDREFWTILLTPDLDARAFRYVLKILGAVFSLFHVRFKDCYVEGIQTDYQTMGYLAATNGFLKAFPYVSDWDLRMDWAREKELHAAGTVRLSITLLRIFCFVLETLVLAGILGISFWRRRARVIKTNELPELGFVRRKILGFILED